MGGPSGEHDISLKSGDGVVRALVGRGWAAQPLVIPKTLTVEEACGFVSDALARGAPDVAFLALHGTFGEDGTIQQLCEDRRVAYTGSDPAASRLGMDKVASRKRFAHAGLAVPRWELVDMAAARLRPDANGASPSSITSSIPCPLVVKPVSQGSSLGVSIVQEPGGLPAALEEAGRFGAHALLEEFIVGRELTVGVLGEEPLPVIEIRPRHSFFDYTAKYTKGLTDYLVPADLPPAITRTVQAAALAAHRALGCRHLSRTDLILTRDGIPVLLEVNTIPGFTPTSLLPKAAACSGLAYDELCEQLVLMAWQESRWGQTPIGVRPRSRPSSRQGSDPTG